jgi:acetyl esterase/lipase
VTLCAALLSLAACTPTGSESELLTPESQPVYPELATYPDIPVIEDIPYASQDGEPQFLDACFPADAALDDPNSIPRPAIVSVHGGSWTRGDKANINWRSVCQWFASEGFVAVSVNYRLAPVHTFPAQLRDVQAAVEWLRDPAQTERYNIDPDRIGAFGGSAGGHLVSLLGTSGAGGWTAGSRVAAVAQLSGPVDLRTGIQTTGGVDPNFPEVQLAFLGCATFADCPEAELASPGLEADPTDPPFFVAHSIDEFIPLSQSEDFVTTLRSVGVDTTFVTVDGSLHSIGMLDDDMKTLIIEFFVSRLGSPEAGVIAQEDEPVDSEEQQPQGVAPSSPSRGE